jgi:hypothetical protein
MWMRQTIQIQAPRIQWSERKKVNPHPHRRTSDLAPVSDNKTERSESPLTFCGLSNASLGSFRFSIYSEHGERLSMISTSILLSPFHLAASV